MNRGANGPSAWTDVEVICVNYRTEHLLPGLMDDVGELRATGLSIATTIVDCSGTLGGTQLPSDVRVLDPGENLGFGQGVNLAVRPTGGATVMLLVNPDVRFLARAVAELVLAVKRGEAVAATGRLRYPDGTLQRNTAAPPSLRQLAREYLAGRDDRDPPSGEKREVGVIAGSLVAVDRESFLKVGGFDPTYPLYIEDVALSLQLAELGRLVQLPIECGSHVGGASAASVSGPTTVLLHAARVEFFRRQSRLRGRAARAIVLVGLALRCALGRELPLLRIAAATSPGAELSDILPGRGTAPGD